MSESLIMEMLRVAETPTIAASYGPEPRGGWGGAALLGGAAADDTNALKRPAIKSEPSCGEYQHSIPGAQRLRYSVPTTEGPRLAVLQRRNKQGHPCESSSVAAV